MSDELHQPLQLFRRRSDPVIVHSKAEEAVGRMLSNFYSCDIGYAGRVFPSVEHAYHAMKAGDGDLVQREQFRDVFSRFDGNDLFCGENGSDAKDAAGRIWNMQGGRSPENWRLRFDAEEEGALIKTDSKSRPRMQWTVRKQEGWREIWQLQIMRKLLRLKFACPEFREALLATGCRPLHHTGDPFWGTGGQKQRWQRQRGLNMHGVLLMELREELV